MKLNICIIMSRKSTKYSDYQCVRCGYESSHKANMRRHLYDKTSTCPAEKNNIELTDEIKEYILKNRIYKVLSQSGTPKITDDTINDTINNIVNNTTNDQKEKDNIPDDNPLNALLRKQPNCCNFRVVYLIWTREFFRHREPVLKIGKTDQIKTRFGNYGKGNQLISVIFVDDSYKVEQIIKKHFIDKFKQRSDIGKEFFEGCLNEMYLDFTSICLPYIAFTSEKQNCTKLISPYIS